eukprot:m.37895 g.37895  ORF g.37895 m.37895 type:complete len:221 (-) comp17778_c0_seq1:100-762(-)
MGSEDDLFHIVCTWDGGDMGPPGFSHGNHPHFVVDLKTDPLCQNWTYVGSIEVSPKSADPSVPIAGEPTPVYEDGPPGDSAQVRYFIAREDGITHGGPGSLRIGLFSLTWVDPTPSPPPPPPPSPPTKLMCPDGWTKHEPGGFWFNTDPCPRNKWTNCTADAENGTATLCANKCVSTPGCVAFDVCADPGPCDCYIFVGGLVEPFTPYEKDLTCVKTQKH